MRVTADMSQRHVLADLRRVQERLATAQSQVAGGKRIEKPSDDPLGAERAMRLNDQLESTGAYRTAVDESRSWLDATDTAPYSAATGDAYQGDASPVVRQIGPGVSVQVNVTGDDVLAGLLPTLRTLSAHLAANDTASLGTTDLQAIDAGFDNLTAKRGLVGAITNRVDAAGARLDDTTDITTAFLADTQDADLPQALTDLSAQQAALQAALRGGATLIQQSLMDFLR
jgi:flagellin-like hook-associated protein FlgL